MTAGIDTIIMQSCVLDFLASCLCVTFRNVVKGCGGQNVPIRKEVDANSAKGWGGGPIKKPLDYSCPIGQMKMCRGALLVIIFCIYVMLLGDVQCA